jgi:spore coat-associated protein N
MKLIPSAVLSISLVLLLAGTGTWAEYSDVETSVGNTLTAGTMDLYMTDNGPVIDREWKLENMVPGTSFKSGQLNLYNDGTVAADHVEISFSNICRDPGAEAGANEESDTLNGADGMDSYLKVDSMTYGPFTGNPRVLVYNGVSRDSSILESTTDNNNYIDLADLNGITMDDLEPPGTQKQNPMDFSMQISFDESAPNDYQGDECTLTLTFVLSQGPSQ